MKSRLQEVRQTNKAIDETIDPDKSSVIYVFEEALVELLERSKTQDTMKAIVEAGLFRLPYPEIVVEFSIGDAYYYVYLKERGMMGIETFYVMLSDQRKCGNITVHPFYITSEMVRNFNGGVKFEFNHIREIQEELIRVNTATAPNSLRKFKHSIHDELHRLHHAMITFMAVYLVVLLLKTNGVISEKITIPEKLNKARLRNKKQPLPDYHVVRIGHVTNKQGQRLTDFHNTRQPHFRAGHIREQAYGPKYSLHRKIYIEPMLVNYVEGTSLPKIPNKHVTA